MSISVMEGTRADKSDHRSRRNNTQLLQKEKKTTKKIDQCRRRRYRCVFVVVSLSEWDECQQVEKKKKKTITNKLNYFFKWKSSKFSQWSIWKNLRQLKDKKKTDSFLIQRHGKKPFCFRQICLLNEQHQGLSVCLSRFGYDAIQSIVVPLEHRLTMRLDNDVIKCDVLIRITIATSSITDINDAKRKKQRF